MFSEKKQAEIEKKIQDKLTPYNCLACVFFFSPIILQS